MAKHVISLFILFSLQAFFHSGLGQYDQTFDFFTLVLAWPMSLCSTVNCRMNPLPRDFTIHGLWPTNVLGALLKDCYDVPYTPITWPELLDGLNRNWPSLVDGADSNFYLWDRQWRKHGTCSLIYYYQMMYFDLAVELRESFDILDQLIYNNIVPSNLYVYSIKRIKDVIQVLTTKAPDVDCLLSRGGDLMISEIRICFTPGGEITHCLAQRMARGCTAEYAYLPETIMQ